MVTCRGRPCPPAAKVHYCTQIPCCCSTPSCPKRLRPLVDQVTSHPQLPQALSCHKPSCHKLSATVSPRLSHALSSGVRSTPENHATYPPPSLSRASPSRVKTRACSPESRELCGRSARLFDLSHTKTFFSKTIPRHEHLQGADGRAGRRRVYEWESSKLGQINRQRPLWAVWRIA